MQNNELKKIYWNDIIDSPLFTAIAQEHIEDMIDYLDGTIKKYKKNETIIHVGDEFRRCGILLDGSLEVSYDTNRFEKHNVNHFYPGQIFGESLALKGIPHSPVQVSALTDSIILFIDLRKLMLSTDRCNKNCLYNHQLILNLMDRMAEQNIFSNLKLRILGQKSLRDRIMIYLTHLHADNPAGAKIPFSQTSLAEFLGVNRSALARELGRMQDEGILTINNKTYRIL
ncbi:MAG: Crp/Fnr family transcriptional regulator [Eubacteriales bacterium]|nr:Crp/Fnr family transcriptional regulator [Eubacteriales bacterium]